MWFIYVDAAVRAPVFACRYIVDEMATRPALDEGEKFSTSASVSVFIVFTIVGSQEYVCLIVKQTYYDRAPFVSNCLANAFKDDILSHLYGRSNFATRLR